ncbi:hypothetical protein EDB92DRAFT_1894060, partial [Lactarius akahatsu]
SALCLPPLHLCVLRGPHRSLLPPRSPFLRASHVSRPSCYSLLFIAVLPRHPRPVVEFASSRLSKSRFRPLVPGVSSPACFLPIPVPPLCTFSGRFPYRLFPHATVFSSRSIRTNLSEVPNVMRFCHPRLVHSLWHHVRLIAVVMQHMKYELYCVEPRAIYDCLHCLRGPSSTSTVSASCAARGIFFVVIVGWTVTSRRSREFESTCACSSEAELISCRDSPGPRIFG